MAEIWQIQTKSSTVARDVFNKSIGGNNRQEVGCFFIRVYNSYIMRYTGNVKIKIEIDGGGGGATEQ